MTFKLGRNKTYTERMKGRGREIDVNLFHFLNALYLAQFYHFHVVEKCRNIISAFETFLSYFQSLSVP